MHLLAFGGSQTIFKHIADTIGLQAGPQPDTACSRRMNVSERALCIHNLRVGTCGQPGRGRWLVKRLTFESQIDTSGKRLFIQRRSFALQSAGRTINPSQFCRLGLFASSRFLGKNERREVGRLLVFFTTRKSPFGTLHDPIQGIVVLGRHRVIFVIVTAGTTE